MNIVGKKILNQNGLSFVEVTVALGVLLTAIISGLTLTTFNLNSSVASENRLLAANLGREAIEVIREKRDSNWLAGDDWNKGQLEKPDDQYHLTVDFDPEVNSWTIVYPDENETIYTCTTDCTLYYNPENGVYYNTQEPDDGLATTFKRLVTINEICWQLAAVNEEIKDDGIDCNSADDLIGWQLTVDVTWRDNNINHEMQLVDRIYNWR